MSWWDCTIFLGHNNKRGHQYLESWETPASSIQLSLDQFAFLSQQNRWEIDAQKVGGV